ncbi:MAG: NAD(P)-dependent alcohol dehydrogenase [Bacteroidales bacterium]|nr:NAD(P)-dependent alcohol dehydrogenase [Bacteroidales bacterium]
MKAFYKLSFKKSDTGIYGDLPDPVADKSQMLIEVKAVSINPVDYKLFNANTGFLPGAKLPKIVGSDFAGIVRKTADGDTKFKVGDRVYGAVPIFFGKPGSLVELLVTETKNARFIPDGMTFQEAASLPVAALTALNGIRRCGVIAGSNLLINGATGGVGHFAVQIAKTKEAVITASCSSVNSELAMQLGADKIIGYRKEDLAHISDEYDAILDAWGQMKFKDIFRLLKKNGTYASPLILLAPAFLTNIIWLFSHKKITSMNMRKREEDYEEIEKLFCEKKLKPVIENIFTLEKASEAFEFAEKGRPRGKVIVAI